MKFKLINSLVGLAFVASLAACGGGGGASSTVNSGVAPPASTVMQGVYAGKIGEAELLSLVVPMSDLTKVRWYGLTFRTAQTDIYSGELTLGAAGVATPNSLMAYLGNVLVSMSGGVTGASLGAYTGSLTIPPSVTPVVIASTAKTSPTFNASQAANLADLDGDWNGDWIDGLDRSDRLLIRFSSSTGKQILSTPSGFIGCTLKNESSATPIANGNFFAVTLKFEHQSGSSCPRINQTLSGVAVVYKPTPSTSRLELIALEPSGKGVSFRADR